MLVTVYLKTYENRKRVYGCMPQVVEHLLSKHEALSSKLQYHKK
jgi:hypothetical protein